MKGAFRSLDFSSGVGDPRGWVITVASLAVGFSMAVGCSSSESAAKAPPPAVGDSGAAGGAGGSAQDDGGATEDVAGNACDPESCDDGISCTVDRCVSDICRHFVGSNDEPGACPDDAHCVIDEGCVANPVCASTEDCQEALSDDPCKVAFACDQASATCRFSWLDSDADGHWPSVCHGDDCDDSDPERYFGAPERCNGLDDDCDDVADEEATCDGLNQVCEAGVCACAPGMCLPGCEDPSVDVNNCGKCGNVCPYGADCEAGECSCPPDMPDPCGGCTDTQTDPYNCGTCGTQCDFGCSLGQCITIRDVAAGGQHLCAMLTDDTVWCWGSNVAGQLGQGQYDGDPHPDAARVSFPGSATIVSIAANLDGTYALDGLGRIWGWGSNIYGQMAMQYESKATSPVLIDLPTESSAVWAGIQMACSDQVGGVTLCWGRNFGGTLGQGTSDNDDHPAPVAPIGLPSPRQLAFGSPHVCAVVASDDLYCWGSNPAGEFGNGTTSYSTFPPQLIASDIEQICAGLGFTCRIDGSKRVACTGNNASGQVGLPETIDNSGGEWNTIALPGDAGELACGNSHVCSRLTNGQVFCWGSSHVGQLGPVSEDGPHPTPVEVPLAGAATGVWTGDYYSCSKLQDASVWCWGSSFYGQLATHVEKNPSPTRLHL